jgi:hypothetical protein
VDWTDTLVGAGVGAAVSAALSPVIAPLMEPWSRRLSRVGRVASREPSVDIHIEDDQASLWAGWPPWMSFSYYFADGLPAELPPEWGPDWRGWAVRLGGCDSAVTMLRQTVTARTTSTVVIQTPIVRDTPRSPTGGVNALYPAPGGPDINPRRYDVNLSGGPNALVMFHEGDADRQAPAPSWRLGPGDVEQLDIWATADDDLIHEWRLELPVLVNGRKELVRANGGKPFVTAGQRAGRPTYLRYGDEWSTYREDPPIQET